MADQSPEAVTPHKEQVIDFYGDPIPIALLHDNDLFVPIRVISEFLRLDWSAQYRRIRRDEVMWRRRRMVTMRGADGRMRDQLCLPLDLLPGWLFGITTSRIADPDLAAKLNRYCEECFRVLWQAFQRFLVSSYTDIPQEMYAAVLAFLDDWGRAAQQRTTAPPN